MKHAFVLVSAIALVGLAQAAEPPAKPVDRPNQPLVIGHGHTDIGKIPVGYVDKARANLRIWYGHTSHGSQITSGMSAINRPPFRFNTDGSGGALQYVEAGGDLGDNGADGWMNETRRYLNTGGEANVIVWSWCGGCSGNSPEGVSRYLQMMDQLEKDYPGRVFVYMTGHLDGTGTGGNLHKVNEQIRDYCRENNKVLFDFADIESFDPSGRPVLSLNADDGCNYRADGKSGNWAEEWIAANPNHAIDLPPDAAHTHPLNGAMKGRAFWWMLARLAGWNPASS